MNDNNNFDDSVIDKSEDFDSSTSYQERARKVDSPQKVNFKQSSGFSFMRGQQSKINPQFMKQRT